MKVVVLCSGGMDSVTALHWARRQEEVAAVLSFDYGAKHNHREIPFAAEHARLLGAPHQVIALDFVNRLFSSALLKSGGEIPEGHYEAATMRQTVVPFRNAIMLSIATGFAESRGARGWSLPRTAATTRFILTAARISCARWARRCARAPTPGVEAAAAVHRVEQGADRRGRGAARRGLRPHLVLLQGRRDPLRAVRDVRRTPRGIVAGLPDPTVYAAQTRAAEAGISRSLVQGLAPRSWHGLLTRGERKHGSGDPSTKRRQSSACTTLVSYCRSLQAGFYSCDAIAESHGNFSSATLAGLPRRTLRTSQ
jgi:hypothetical protein